MARNAKADLAKHQAVGINKANALLSQASVHDVEYSRTIRDHAGQLINSLDGKRSIIGPKGLNDRRLMDGAKPCFNQGKAAPVTTAPRHAEFMICPTGMLSTGKIAPQVTCGGKRSQATPQARGHMNTFAGREKQGKGATVVWAAWSANSFAPIVKARTPTA